MATNAIQRTSRICFRYTTIYCSSKILQTITEQEIIMQLNQKWFPCKGESDRVLSLLTALASREPDEFANSSLDILGIKRSKVNA